jgi:hypothetical protein
VAPASVAPSPTAGDTSKADVRPEKVAGAPGGQGIGEAGNLQTPEVPKPSPVSAPVPNTGSDSGQPQVSGRVHRLSGISIKPTGNVPPGSLDTLPTLEEQKSLPPLDLETLMPAWTQTLEQLEKELPKLVLTLKEKELRVDGNDHFLILVNNSYTESEIKPHLVQLLGILRKLLGRPMLNCGIEVVYEEKEAIVYSPRDKYDVMSAANPALNTFRVLFPEVDY